MIRLASIALISLLAGCRDATRKKAAPPPTAATKPLAFHFQDSAYSSIELRPDTVNGFTEVEQIATTQAYRYVLFHHYFPGMMVVEEALVSERTRRHVRDAPEYYGDDTVQLHTRLANGFLKYSGRFDSVAWARTFTAYELHYGRDYIDAVQGSPYDRRRHRLLDYNTGRTLIQYSSQLYAVQHTDNGDWRYIGYLHFPKGRELDDFDDLTGDVYGAVLYTNPLTGKKQSLFLYARDAEADRWRGIYFDSLTLEGVRDAPNAEGLKRSAGPGVQWRYSNFQSFRIVVHFGGAARHSLRIPVRNDRIDTAGLRSELFTFRLLDSNP